jgi:hypothetical protein
MIHTIGDSHSYNGWPNTVQMHHLGALLCYSFGAYKLARCDLRRMNINDGDTIVFCLGEIDCRCHIHKHISEAPYQTIIDGIVIQYFDTINMHVNILQRNLKNVCVYNIVPPIQRHNTEEDPGYPFVGSDEERKEYVLYFNRKLKEFCERYKYVFFDVYDKYTDANGFLRKDLSDGKVHIENGQFIREFISTSL